MDAIFSNQLIIFIAGIAILIFVHEMGHFVAAKLLKVDVEEFGIGFPPRIVTLFEALGTKFSLNWIPLGGFVRLSGENDPEVEGGFAASKPWVRLMILAAGPITNILVGLLLGILFIYSVGEEVPGRVLIKDLIDDAPAQLTGFEQGDVFLSINGVPIETTTGAIEEIQKYPNTPILIEIEREGEILTIEVVPEPDKVTFEDGSEQEIGKIGALIGNDRRPVAVTTAIVDGTVEFTNIIKFIGTFPVQLIRGEISPEEGRFVGYRGMFEIYQATPSPLWFFMMISIMLGIFNLLPIPALDGGRIALILPEILLRRRVPAKYENIIHLVGFIVLILFMIYVNIQDWINPIQLPQ